MATWQVTEVQKYLKGAQYPASGRQLADLAKGNGAEDELVEALGGIREVDGPNGVMKELAGSFGGPTPGPQKDRGPRDDVEGPAFQVDDVQRHLQGAEYPSSGSRLADLAKSNGAGQDLVDVLSGIGDVDGPTDVMRELKPHLGGPEGG